MAIDKLTKELCVGCAACEGVCPLECIVMQVDEDGFRYPHVDHDRCVECGRCDNVCPALSPREEQWAERAYAAINQDRQTREVSTSGGVFTALAESILDRGGVIYGAIYDEAWRVVHHRVDQRDDLALIRGSKYSQSDMSGVVSWVLQDLRAGRWVLFSGTQCQVDGVRRAAGKSLCDKLLLVDMICHGVPSPMIFEHFNMARFQ